MCMHVVLFRASVICLFIMLSFSLLFSVHFYFVEHHHILCLWSFIVLSLVDEFLCVLSHHQWWAARVIPVTVTHNLFPLSSLAVTNRMSIVLSTKVDHELFIFQSPNNRL